MPRMQFGLQLGQERVTWPQLLEGFQRGEELGFDTLWAHDHFIPADPGQMEGPCMDGWTVLAAVAALTSRIRLGVMVTGVTYRHPAILAKQAVTVDQISNGRLIFGIGAAWYEREHIAYGVPFATTGERVARLGEAVALIKALWTQDKPSFQGKYYQLHEAPFDPRPVQQPHPPILIGGGGEKRTLRIAARYADMINCFGSPAVLRHKIEVLREHCRAVGRNPDEIEKTVMTGLVLTDSRERADQIVQSIATARGMTPEEARASVLIGPPEDIVKQVQAFAYVGVSQIIFGQRAPYRFDLWERFAKEVMSAYK